MMQGQEQQQQQQEEALRPAPRAAIPIVEQAAPAPAATPGCGCTRRDFVRASAATATAMAWQAALRPGSSSNRRGPVQVSTPNARGPQRRKQAVF